MKLKIQTYKISVIVRIDHNNLGIVRSHMHENSTSHATTHDLSCLLCYILYFAIDILPSDNPSSLTRLSSFCCTFFLFPSFFFLPAFFLTFPLLSLFSPSLFSSFSLPMLSSFSAPRLSSVLPPLLSSFSPHLLSSF